MTKAKSARCLCYTAKKQRCKRNAMIASDYCWQHQGCLAPYLAVKQFQCTDIDMLKKFTSNPIALVEIYLACVLYDLPVLAGVRVWHDIVRTAKKIASDIPKRRKLSYPKRTALVMNRLIRKYKKTYQSSRTNFIANWYFDGTCNCICAAALLLGIAKEIKLRQPFMALIKGHMFPLLMDRHNKLSYVSTMNEIKIKDEGRYQLPATIQIIAKNPDYQAMILFFVSTNNIARFSKEKRKKLLSFTKMNVNVFLSLFPETGKKFIYFWKEPSVKTFDFSKASLDELGVLWAIIHNRMKYAKLNGHHGKYKKLDEVGKLVVEETHTRMRH